MLKRGGRGRGEFQQGGNHWKWKARLYYMGRAHYVRRGVRGRKIGMGGGLGINILLYWNNESFAFLFGGKVFFLFLSGIAPELLFRNPPSFRFSFRFSFVYFLISLIVWLWAERVFSTWQNSGLSKGCDRWDWGNKWRCVVCGIGLSRYFSRAYKQLLYLMCRTGISFWMVWEGKTQRPCCFKLLCDL